MKKCADDREKIDSIGGFTKRDISTTMNTFGGKSALVYDQWYEKPKNKRLVELEKKALVEMMEPQKGENLLDIGCGTGYFTHYFSQKGLRVIGLDISDDMLTIARIKTQGVKLIQGDAQKLPFKDRAFDITMTITTIEFTQNPDRVLQELYRVCKRVFVLGVLNKLSWLGLKRKLKKGAYFTQATFYSVQGLKNLIRHSLGDVEIRITLPFRSFIAASIPKL